MNKIELLKKINLLKRLLLVATCCFLLFITGCSSLPQPNKSKIKETDNIAVFAYSQRYTYYDCGYQIVDKHTIIVYPYYNAKNGYDWDNHIIFYNVGYAIPVKGDKTYEN